jgi:hypothetical protein
MEPGYFLSGPKDRAHVVGTARGITKLYGVAAEDGGLAHQRAPRVRSMGARTITPASWSPLTSTLPRGPAAVVDVDHVSPAASGIAPRVQIPRVLGPRRNHCTCRDAARDGDGHQSLFLVFLLYCPRAFVPLSPRCLQRKRRGEERERRGGRDCFASEASKFRGRRRGARRAGGEALPAWETYAPVQPTCRCGRRVIPLATNGRELFRGSQVHTTSGRHRRRCSLRHGRRRRGRRVLGVGAEATQVGDEAVPRGERSRASVSGGRPRWKAAEAGAHRVRPVPTRRRRGR